MNDEEFEKAIAALREEGDRPAPSARLTRERILRDLRPGVRRRRVVWWIPLAAILAGSTVLAATGKFPEVFQATARALGLEPIAAPEVEGPTGAARPGRGGSEPGAKAAEAVTAVQEEKAGTPPGDEPPAPEVAVRAPELPSRPRKPRVDAGAALAAAASEPSAAPATAVVAAAPEDEGTLPLYRKARKLHYVDQNHAAALAAWDAYLAAEPNGPLAVDARYARALCLVRLGRKQEARAALQPFAAGTYGSFRQDEARSLLDALH